MIEIEDLSKQILLQGLDEDDYRQLLPLLETRHYDQGAFVFKEEDPHEGIYLIKKGRIKISKSIQSGHRKTLVVFREGNYFGDLSALEQRVHSAAAQALTDTELYLLKSEYLACRSPVNVVLVCKLIKKLALIAGNNLRRMNAKYLRLGESF